MIQFLFYVTHQKKAASFYFLYVLFVCPEDAKTKYMVHVVICNQFKH
jgi:hypothetical protein